MIVDVHHHYALETYYTDYKDFPAELVESMDRNGISYTCLNGVGPQFYNHGNEEVLKAVKRFPDRIIGIGHLEIDRRKPAFVDELLKKGMRGLKIISTLRPYDDDKYLPFYERAAAHRMPILFHTGFLGGNSTGKPRDESSDWYRPIRLDRIARLFPELPMIAAHLGTLAWYLEAIAVMRNKNVYGDISGSLCGFPPAFYRMPGFDRLDWEKVMFGSDSLPYDVHIPLQSTRRLMSSLRLAKETRERILGGNAAKIFGLAD